MHSCSRESQELVVRRHGFVQWGPEKLSQDAQAAFDAWRAAGGDVTADMPRADECGLVVDGLFGIGLQREIGGAYAERVAWINAARARVLALDVPTGIESDSGRVLGTAVRATHTMTFIALKPGLLTLDGPDHCGALHIASLALDTRALLEPAGHVIGPEAIPAALPRRRLNTHKGDYGSTGIIGGATGMAGAAVLAGRAALNLGAGRVYVGFAALDVPAFDPVQPELMFRSADEVLALDHLTCLAAGPGLGQSAEAKRHLTAALSQALPLVIDADALNMIAADEKLAAALASRSAPAVLTPHPAEAARLLHVSDARSTERPALRGSRAGKDVPRGCRSERRRKHLCLARWTVEYQHVGQPGDGERRDG